MNRRCRTGGDIADNPGRLTEIVVTPRTPQFEEIDTMAKLHKLWLKDPGFLPARDAAANRHDGWGLKQNAGVQSP